ncbi:MAG: hypothetical protein A2457_03785 [Candidatus Yanofskybacteria bacterium RIFOXYC2_FULL_44_13]|nr:MAG: hypothetical protein A2457_03785 [Candidatus Yanofskybacteria bacterium RIFOXYC2_FULL_44_13]
MKWMVVAAFLMLISVVMIIFMPLQTAEEKQAAIDAKRAQQAQLIADREANEQKVEAERIKQGRQNNADDVVRSIYYVQDPRTTPPTCFAHRSVSSQWTGGPALATVSCEAIPPNLLVIANAK